MEVLPFICEAPTLAPSSLPCLLVLFSRVLMSSTFFSSAKYL